MKHRYKQPSSYLITWKYLKTKTFFHQNFHAATLKFLNCAPLYILVYEASKYLNQMIKHFYLKVANASFEMWKKKTQVNIWISRAHLRLKTGLGRFTPRLYNIQKAFKEWNFLYAKV